MQPRLPANSALDNIHGKSAMGQTRKGADSVSQFSAKAVSFQEPRIVDTIIENAIHKKKSHLLFREQAQSIIDKKDNRQSELADNYAANRINKKPSTEAIKVYSGDFESKASMKKQPSADNLAENLSIMTEL